MRFPWQQAYSAERVLLLPDNITPPPFLLSLFPRHIHTYNVYVYITIHAFFSQQNPDCLINMLDYTSVSLSIYLHLFLINQITLYHIYIVKTLPQTHSHIQAYISSRSPTLDDITHTIQPPPLVFTMLPCILRQILCHACTHRHRKVRFILWIMNKPQ